MYSEVRKRPKGLILIAVVWFPFGLYNLLTGSQTLIADVGALPYLSNSSLNPWFAFGVPVETLLSLVIVITGILQMSASPGLWIGKRYSYKLGLAIPILVLTTYVIGLVLYGSAPVELQLNSVLPFEVGGIGGGVVWLIVYWGYLRKPHVKAFLGVYPPPPQDN